MYYKGNRYLNREEMTVNANYIWNYLSGLGWTRNAVSGMLGNMESESTINPALWESLESGNLSRGYGLVQWTPATNLINWANARNLPIDAMDTNLERILYELANGLQYIPTGGYPLSFQQFTQSVESPEWLASAFLKNYERAGVEVESNRRNQARYWFENLTGETVGIKPHFPTTEGLAISSPYGWRTVPYAGWHYAIDITGAGVNHPIYATQSGVVIENTWHDISGWRMRIRHTADPYYSQYLHMAVRSPMSVGTVVERGQEIGTMGTTGSSTGIHLDFAIAISANGFFTDGGTIDPEVYLQMEFGGGGGGGQVGDGGQATLTMLLSDCLNGWKY